jgi:hypothetical protein
MTTWLLKMKELRAFERSGTPKPTTQLDIPAYPNIFLCCMGVVSSIVAIAVIIIIIIIIVNLLAPEFYI